ncbi:hypothetical protein H0176_23740 [Methylorubrum populi]|uniref:hypothetical protein n=1 Tax=Methylorubrum rhodesianum TaxID=29427 RepID=UPI00190C1D09|nr:hypothetical protein [Methylorubrum rhodesianum]MBK3406249.1 hypothetical protein [Methylorubrum rhodesianum]MBY0143257.1 hypothetical protein [Methylorubrum populi]
MSIPAQGAVGAETMTAGPGDLLYRSEWETTRTITHDEAHEIARRLIASHFNRTDCETARASIPANPDRDDDLLINSYIKQQARKDAATPAPRTDGGMTAGEGRRPIKDAPKDGTRLLCLTILRAGKDKTPEWNIGHYDHAAGGWFSEEGSDIHPTDFYPLPDWRSATPAQPAGAVPDSLRVLSEAAIEAASAAYYDGMMGEWPHTLGWAGKPEKFKASVRTHMATALAAALASHPAGQSAGSGADILAATLAEFQRRNGHHKREIEELLTEFGELLLSKAQPAPDSTRTGQEEAEEVAKALYRHDYGAYPDQPEWDAAIAAVQKRYRALAGAALAARPAAPEAQGLERVRHVKRGTEYEVLGEAEAQISRGMRINFGAENEEFYRHLHEGMKLTVYRGSDGKLWCRFTDEMRDGRFVPAPPASSGQGGR